MVDSKEFRADFFYRLGVIPVTLPPLRERREDIPILVEHFVKKKCGEMNIPLKRLTDTAISELVNYPWPGNVRELENVIERTMVLSDGDEIKLNDLSLELDERQVGDTAGGVTMPLNKRLDEIERDYIARAMEEAKHVKTKAAELLGIKTSALYYKLDKYDLE